jgi:hypothetical protein
MRVARTLATTADEQRSVVEVNVRPPQAERFPLPQAKREGYSPPCAVPALIGLSENFGHFRYRVGLYLLFG